MNTENASKKLRILSDLAKDMKADGDLNEKLQLLVDKSRELLGTDTSFLGLRDEQTDEIFIHTLSGIQTEEFSEIRLPVGKGLGGLVAETQEGRITKDYFSDANIFRADKGVEKIVRKEGLISAVAVPIQIGKNNIGVLYAFNRTRTTFSQADIKTLSVAGNLAALEIARRRLAESQEALLLKEEEFRVISRTTTDAVVLMDEDGKISYWNAAAEKMFNYSEEEVKEKQKAEEKDLHHILAPREFYQAYKKGFAQFQKTGQGPVVGKSLEFTAVKKDGTKFPIEVSISAIKLKGKWRAAGIIRDLSYRKKNETELQRLSYFDVLTGIANRSLYEEILDREWRRAVRQNNWLSMVMCKINQFNEFRYIYGPSESYNFLTKVANALNSHLRRSYDLIVRYDDDLFLIVLPEIEKKAAEDLRTKLLESAEKALENEKKEKTNCDFSIVMGAATIKPSQQSPRSSLFSACEQNLIKERQNTHKRGEIYEVRDPRLHILHISDLHMRKKDQATTLRALLRIDIKSGLQLNKLNFLVISGDVAAYSTPDEYEAALDLVFGVARDFDVDPSRIVVVPGNHDLNYESSKKAYKFHFIQDLPGQLSDGTYYLAGEEGALVRDDKLYGSRFTHFFSHFYKKLTAREYSLSSNEHAILYKYEKERILFLGLNSCSEIDHHFEKRAKIDEVALSETLSGFHVVKENVKDWLKVAVCHHPVTGSEQMNETGFLKLLAAEGFCILMHGHTHKADAQSFNNSQENIQTIGAGTFGARPDELATASPWQYNLLTFDPAIRTIIVNTRKREELFGPWGPDYRWGNDPNKLLPYYRIEL